MNNITMQALQIDEFNGFESAHVREINLPQPGSGEVLVKVRAAGLNSADLAVAAGIMQPIFPLELPATLGGEISGVVAVMPEGENDWKTGDEVHALPGTFSG